MNRRNRWPGMLGCVLALVVLFGVLSSGQQTKKKRTVHKSQTTVLSKHQDTAGTRAPAPVDSIRLAPVSPAADSGKKFAPPPFQYRKVENHAFAVGERLTFDVNYGFITAGTAVMAIPSYQEMNGRRCYRVEFTVNSLPSFSWVYKVEDRYLTFIDVDAIAPLRFEQHIREGSYSRD
ncbi:MAG: DUF3108 domain-containing protein, partial [Bacteroidota bacterium]